MAGQKFLPLNGINTDIANQLMPSNQARFIKNLVYSLDDAAIASDTKNSQEGTFKPLQSNALYIENLVLPTNGYTQTIGYLSSKETKEVYVFVYNSENGHLIYKLNGYDGTYDIVYQKPLLNFQLDPENFIHQGGAWLEVVYISDPLTGDIAKKSFLVFTDGDNFQRQICVEDSIATNGFDPIKFPFFAGIYDPQIAINMGVATPNDCIQIIEVPRTAADAALPNNLLFNPWYFRLLYVDVWGRPSEHGIISDEYVPGINDCIGASSSLPRCLDLKFKAPNPFINAVQVEFMKCGDAQWSISDTLFLWDGSNLGNWWERQRNPLINYNDGDGTITYRFCRDKECQPVAATDTSRLYNPLPRQSQAVTKVGDYISLCNNKDGFLPFTSDQTNAFKFTVIPPTTVGVNAANIDILVPIYNPALNNLQSVVKDGTNGYIWGDNNSKHGGARAYQQYFKDLNQSGFGGYLAGTGNFVISTQWYIDGSGNLVQDKSLDGNSLSPRGLSFLRFNFSNVPKGQYIFRLFSHLTDPTVDPNWAQTSTTVWGISGFQASGFIVSPQRRLAVQELQIDVCNGDYSSLNDTKVLTVCDLAAFDPNAGKNLSDLGLFGINTGQSFKATCGYVYETNQNGFNERPMELMSVTNPHSLSYSDYLTNIGSAGTIGLVNPLAKTTFTSLITDHNGFYYYSTEGSNFTFSFAFQYKCHKTQFNQGTGSTGLTFHSPLIIDQIKDSGGRVIWADYAADQNQTATGICNRVYIKGTAVLASNSIGVPNLTVTLTRGQTAITDSEGNFTIIAHDDILAGHRNDLLVYSPSGCAYTDINGNCLSDQPISFDPCITCSKRIINVQDIILYFINQRGLLSGGVYAVGAVGFDWMGRCGFVQPLGNITIPTITESQTIGASKVQVNIDPNAVFPSDFTYMTLWLTRETTIDSYIDWITDQVEFIDSTGAINNTSPTQIRIYYASIIEYNKQNNFNTTDTWDFLEPLPANAAANAVQTPYQQDTVQFFVNGDGTFFFDGKTHLPTDKPVNITALVKYDQAGQYFLIDYSSALAGLLPNALVRLSRPKVCTGDEPFFEICQPILLTNGKASPTSFILNAFDTYYLNRTIPVPTPVNPSNASTVSTTTKTTNNADGSQTIVTTTVNETVNTVNEQRQFGFLFEHDAPSNFWGKGCFNGGRENVKNPYETVIYDDGQVALSGTLSANNQLNYLNYFDESRKFSLADVNGIVAAFPETGVVLVVGQSDCYTVGFNDNIVRINSQGQAIAPSANNTFGEPENKIGFNYGCQYADKNTLAKREGKVLWLDTDRAAVIIHNYKEPDPVSKEGMDGYFTTKIKSVQQFNALGNGTRYFHGVINPVNNEYLLTDFLIGSGSFINALRDYDVSVQETTSFGIFSKIWKGQYGFTPEYYAYLDGDLKGQQLFSFTNAKAYAHYQSIGNVTYGTMYGTQIGRNVRFVFAVDQLKKKKIHSFAVYCKQGAYFCDQITTETGQVSRTLLANITEADFGFYGAFLCDLNTIPDPNLPNQTGINALMDGDVMIGLWAIIDMVGNPFNDTFYSELNGFVINYANAEKSGTDPIHHTRSQNR